MNEEFLTQLRTLLNGLEGLTMPAQGGKLGQAGAAQAASPVGGALGSTGLSAVEPRGDNVGKDADLLTRLANRLADRQHPPYASMSETEDGPIAGKVGAQARDLAEDEEVEYTYKQGDTFGQVIKDLGMNTDYGLWGDNGDVKYYEQQLREQGWKGGNIPIGTKIKLRKRPNVKYDMYGQPMKG